MEQKGSPPRVQEKVGKQQGGSFLLLPLLLLGPTTTFPPPTHRAPYLSAWSRVCPLKSKKERKASATIWLNSLLWTDTQRSPSHKGWLLASPQLSEGPQPFLPMAWLLSSPAAAPPVPPAAKGPGERGPVHHGPLWDAHNESPLGPSVSSLVQNACLRAQGGREPPSSGELEGLKLGQREQQAGPTSITEAANLPSPPLAPRGGKHNPSEAPLLFPEKRGHLGPLEAIQVVEPRSQPVRCRLVSRRAVREELRRKTCSVRVWLLTEALGLLHPAGPQGGLLFGAAARREAFIAGIRTPRRVLCPLRSLVQGEPCMVQTEPQTLPLPRNTDCLSLSSGTNSIPE